MTLSMRDISAPRFARMLRNLDVIFAVRSDKTGACAHAVGYAEPTVGGGDPRPCQAACISKG